MRICFVVHGFPPAERTGVENYTLGLSRALARAGHQVEVFVPRKDPLLADLALRREERDGFAVNWITNNHDPGSPREALLVPELRRAFEAFLERERPEIVHFQHLIKLGLGLVDVAREHGLPTVYTAHDYYPICHRYTLLRPDLSVCDARGDSRACSRCDLAQTHLNALPGLGDYQAGVLPAQLDAAAWNTLQGILADRAEEHDLASETFRAAHEQRAELDQLRARAYHGFDVVLAPSRFLIGELVRGGFEPERVQHAPLGFDNSDLAGVPPVRVEPGRAVRFAYIGGLGKHKGVHVLLDAFARVPGGAELSIWGFSTDRAYLELLRERCGEVGAEWRGAFERADLPGVLATIDALVVPSLWFENYPLVIHEGFSAGRPVLASRLGAIPECVRDGVDGLLFAPGDADDLARVLRRCVDEPGLLPSLARGIRPVKDMDSEARDLAGRYEVLVQARRRARSAAELPASLERPLARFEELAALPARELFVRVLAGLDDLRASWTGELGELAAVELLASGLGAGSDAQDRLREARNEIAWLRTKKEELDEGREELMKLFEDLDKLLTETRAGSARQAEHLESAGVYVRKKEDEVVQAHERMRALEEAIAQKNRHIGAVETRLEEAGRNIRDREEEFRDVETRLQEAGRYIRHKEQEFRDVEDRLRKAVELGETREKVLREGEERQRALGADTRTVAQVGVLALKAQERILHGALRPLLERLHALLDPEGELRLPADGASFAELIENLHRAGEGVQSAASELEWRRPMHAELEWHRSELGTVRAELDRSASELESVRAEVERWTSELARARTELAWRRAEMQRLVSQGWLRLFLRPGKLRRRLARWRARPAREEKP